MLRMLFITAVIGLLATGLVIFNQATELKETRIELSRITNDLNNTKNENKRLRVTNSVLEGATRGLHATKPETIKEVNLVINHILESKSATEEKFKECWNRKLQTTDWGSDGPEGLLDDCIDHIAQSKNAILIKDIERKAEAARYICRSESTLGGRYEMAKNCLADRNYRLLASAFNSLFESLTTPHWIENLNNSVSE